MWWPSRKASISISKGTITFNWKCQVTREQKLWLRTSAHFSLRGCPLFTSKIMKNSSPGSPCTTIFCPSSNWTGSNASATVRRSHLSRDSKRQISKEFLCVIRHAKNFKTKSIKSQLPLSATPPVTCRWPTHPPESRGPEARLTYTNSSSGKGMKRMWSLSIAKDCHQCNSNLQLQDPKRICSRNAEK